MDLAQEKKTFLNKFKEADSQDSLNSLKIEYLGKKGVLSSLMSQLSNAPAEKKPKLGKSINEFKSLIEESISSSLEKIEQSALDEQLSKEAIDVTLPLKSDVGSYHPVSLIAQEISNYFKNKGYVLREGPEIESEYFNFSALNIPENHPARDMHDTFYFDRWQPFKNSYLARSNQVYGIRISSFKNIMSRKSIQMRFRSDSYPYVSSSGRSCCR